MSFMTVHSIGNVIIPTDSELSEGWLNHQPETIVISDFILVSINPIVNDSK